MKILKLKLRINLMIILRFFVNRAQVDSYRTRKLALYALTVDSSQLTFLPSSKPLDTETTTNIKNPARSNLDIVPSLRIGGQFPAPIVNGGGDSYHAFIDLYLHAKFHLNQWKLFVDGWTYTKMDEPYLVQSHVTQKLRQISNIWSNQI